MRIIAGKKEPVMLKIIGKCPKCGSNVWSASDYWWTHRPNKIPETSGIGKHRIIGLLK